MCVTLFSGCGNKTEDVENDELATEVIDALVEGNNNKTIDNKFIITVESSNSIPDTVSEIEIGDFVTFGEYEQDGKTDTKEAVEWIVLDKDGDEYLLVSRYCLDVHPYEEDGSWVTWEDSDIREWLNSTFINDAFSAEEQEMILPIYHINEDNPVYGTEGGESTTDNVFILSYSEATSYYRVLSCQAASTPYAVERGAFQRDGSGYGWYWLRTPGEHSDTAMYLGSGGYYVEEGEPVCNYQGGVRPCVWIDACEYKSGHTSLKNISATTLEIADVGDRVSFGTYEQDGVSGNGGETIEWIVLDKRGQELLLLSRYCLDSQPYEQGGGSVMWADSWIRDWLNDVFIENSFSADEQKMIQYTTCYNNDNPMYYTSSGRSTEDKVFLLSADEVEAYLTTLHAEPTEYALDQGAFFNESSRNSWWWLRTAGEDSDMACYISSGGFFMYEGVEVERSDGGIRPAMWISTAETNSASLSVDIPTKTPIADPTTSASDTEFKTGVYWSESEYTAYGSNLDIYAVDGSFMEFSVSWPRIDGIDNAIADISGNKAIFSWQPEYRDYPTEGYLEIFDDGTIALTITEAESLYMVEEGTYIYEYQGTAQEEQIRYNEGILLKNDELFIWVREPLNEKRRSPRENETVMLFFEEDGMLSYTSIYEVDSSGLRGHEEYEWTYQVTSDKLYVDGCAYSLYAYAAGSTTMSLEALGDYEIDLSGDYLLTKVSEYTPNEDFYLDASELDYQSTFDEDVLIGNWQCIDSNGYLYTMDNYEDGTSNVGAGYLHGEYFWYCSGTWEVQEQTDNTYLVYYNISGGDPWYGDNYDYSATIEATVTTDGIMLKHIDGAPESFVFDMLYVK